MPHPHQAANQAGTPRPYGRWDSAQDARLTALWASENIREIASQLQRSPDAVRRHAVRLGLVPFSPMDGAFSQADLASNFGVNHHTVARWAHEGLLEGSQHPVTRRWSFTYDQVQAFVVAHRDELPPRLRWVMRIFAEAVEASTQAALQAMQASQARPKRGKPGAA